MPKFLPIPGLETHGIDLYPVLVLLGFVTSTQPTIYSTCLSVLHYYCKIKQQTTNNK